MACKKFNSENVLCRDKRTARYYYTMQWLSHVVNTKGGIGLMGSPGMDGQKGDTGEKGMLCTVCAQ